MTIYPTSIINHATRIKLGLTAIEMIVSEYYLYRSMTENGFEYFKEPNNVTAEILGLSSSLISKADTALQREGYIQKDGPKKRVTQRYLMAVKVAASGQHVQSSNTELAKHFLTRMQETVRELNCDVKVLSPDNKATLKSVSLLVQNINNAEKITKSDLDILIYWAVKDWGFSDSKKYVRPSTLLRSAAQYRKYLLTAKQYIKNKIK